MNKCFLAGAFALALLPGEQAEAVTFSASTSFPGDVCGLDTDGDSGFDDCRTIEQPGTNNPVGVFSLTLDGLNPDASSDATVSISVAEADLFTDSGANNRLEFFALSIDSLFLGVLFDRSTSNEALINAGLAASVSANIVAATGTTDAISLMFDIPLAEFAPLISDGSLTFFFDFSDDPGVGAFLDPEVSVSYAVPLPGGLALLLTGLAGLGCLRRLRAAAGRHNHRGAEGLGEADPGQRALQRA